MKKSLFVTAMIIGFIAILISIPQCAAEENVNTQVVELRVGDSFLYSPSAEGAYISAYGEGVIGSVAARDGAFLSWESDELSGTAVAVGTYNVTMMATWTQDGQIIQAYQVILFVVAENNGEAKTVDYGSGPSSIDGWTQTVEVQVSSSSDDNNNRTLTMVDVLCIGMVGVCATIHVIRRDPLSLIFTVAFTALTVCDLFGVIL